MLMSFMAVSPSSTAGLCLLQCQIQLVCLIESHQITGKKNAIAGEDDLAGIERFDSYRNPF